MPRLLIVDDEPDVEAMISQFLRRRVRSGELDLIFAGDGFEALEALERSGDVDLVLTDINMPGMDGLRLLGELGERGYDLKTVVISAYGDMPNIRAAMNRGAFDFLTKPIEFEDLERTIDKSLAEMTKVRRAAHVEVELLDARRIQQDLLPAPAELADEPRLALGAAIAQARDVGGDFYDFFRIGEDHVFVVIGDVSGKGLAAGILMAVTKALTKAAALRCQGDPAAVLAEVNRALCVNNASLHFVTMIAVLVDCRTGTVTIVNAGHEPAMLLGDGAEPQLFHAGAPPVGLVPDVTLSAEQSQLAPDRMLLLVTDGLCDTVDPADNSFGRSAILTTLSGDGPSVGPDTVINQLLKAAEAHRKGADQADDLALVGLKWMGSSPAS
ncbi:MAG: SpoIIE family protein phosphatase [Pseudomonadota bacterium]